MNALFQRRSFSLLSALLIASAVTLAGCDNSGDNKTGTDGKTPTTKGDKKGDGKTAGKDGKDGKTGDKKIKIAFVTNQIHQFWNYAKSGCLDAEKDLKDVEVTVRMPEKPTADVQKRVVQDVLTSGVDAIAISPLDASNQVQFLNDVASKVTLITHDSDAPQSNRLLYIGMDNYKAGRAAGELARQALPDGGNVMIFIGRLEQDNSKFRRQGVIDELLGRDRDIAYYKGGGAFDPAEEEIKGDKYTIIRTITDDGTEETAKRKAADAINAYPQMNVMVGLFAYNPPAIYQALKQAGKLGTIKIVGFDEADLTMQGIKEGKIVGTVVQNPYQYGYKSVEILRALVKGDKSVIPESKMIDIEARKITKENIDAFMADLETKKGG